MRHIRLLVAGALCTLSQAFPVQASESLVRVGCGDSVRAALRTARSALAKGRSATIRFAPGVHRLKEPILLTAEDSGLTLEGEGAVLSGGRTVTGWKAERDGTWSAEIPFARTNGTFRMFKMNGVLRPRARWPKKGVVYTAGEDKPANTPAYDTPHWSFRFNPGELDANWEDLGEAEIVVCHFWSDSHLRIRRIDATSNTVWLVHPAYKSLSDAWGNRDARWYVENLREIMTEPGEWCLDSRSGRIRYRPMPGERIETACGEVPFLRNLVTVCDKAKDPRQRVRNVTFRGLTFADCHYALAENDVNNRQAAEQTDPAVQVFHSDNIRFERCCFRELEAYAVGFLTGAQECVLDHCRLIRLGAGGVKITSHGYYALTEPGNEEAVKPDPVRNALYRARRNVVADCEIADYGRIFHAAVGVMVQHAEGNLVTHNHIHDGLYSGVSCGWVWGYGASESRDNEISYNHVHDIGKGLLSDMGAIYTLGISPGTVIRNNHIHHVDAHTYGGWGVYCDEGSTHVLVEDNVVHDTRNGGFVLHYGKEITVRNNIFAFGREDQVGRERKEFHVSLYFHGNIVCWETGKLFHGRWWDDEEYEFVNGPPGKGIPVKTKETFRVDHNLYFCFGKGVEDRLFGSHPDRNVKCSWTDWRKTGKDVHSLYADPLFADASKRDFTLKPESPAFRLGFRPIDLSSVGPRPMKNPAK